MIARTTASRSASVTAVFVAVVASVGIAATGPAGARSSVSERSAGLGSVTRTTGAASAAPGEVTMAAKALRSSRRVRSGKKTLRVCTVAPGRNRVCRTKVVDAPIQVPAPTPAGDVVPSSGDVPVAAPADAASSATPPPAAAAAAAAPAPVPAAGPLPSEADDVKAKGGFELNAVPLMARINDYRQANGRSYLPRSTPLATDALSWSFKMADTVSVGHDPTLTVGRLENVHGNWGWVPSCTFAVADLGTVTNRVFETFRTSPAHNQNMLADNVQTQGAGMVCVPDAEYGARIYVTSRFSTG